MWSIAIAVTTIAVAAACRGEQTNDDDENTERVQKHFVDARVYIYFI